MSKWFSIPAAAGVASLVALYAGPANAGAVSFVTMEGVDAGDCSSPAAPCKTVNFALSKTVAGGEIKIVGAGNYLPFAVTKPISITGVTGASITRINSGDAININVPAPAPAATFVNDVVSISGLELNGRGGLGTNGIRVDQVGHLTIRNCSIIAFSSAAVNIIPTRDHRFLIEDTVISNNGNEAIRVRAPGLTARGSLNRVSSVNNGFAGMRVFNGGNVNVADSVFSGNLSDNILIGAGVGIEVGGAVSVSRSSFLGGGSGIRVLGGSELRIENSSITGNNKGLELSAGVVVKSAGNNFIRGNTTDVQGPGTIDITGGQR